MKTKIIIKDPAGMHARPASIVSSQASKFDSDIKITFNGNEADMKSIMSIMMLGITKDAEVEILAEGTDAEKAIESIQAVMKENNLI